jgi:DNA polymerase (family 10)
MPRRNEEISRLLHNIAKLLVLGAGKDHFRIRAYEEAARTIAAMDEDIDELRAANRLEEIPGVGASIAAKVAEYLDTGRCAYYEDLKRAAPVQAVALLEVSGIGPARAKLLSERLGITTVAELEQAARNHALQRLPVIGAKLEEKVGREASRVSARFQRMQLGVALPAAEEVAHALQAHPAVEQITPAGSIRRKKETIGDIDLLVASPRPAEVLIQGPTRGSVLMRNNLQIDLRIVAPEDYGAALLYFTCSKEHIITLRTLAMAHGWKLSDMGSSDAQGQRIASL